MLNILTLNMFDKKTCIFVNYIYIELFGIESDKQNVHK